MQWAAQEGMTSTSAKRSVNRGRREADGRLQTAERRQAKQDFGFTLGRGRGRGRGRRMGLECSRIGK
jgi:hypothetical protein